MAIGMLHTGIAIIQDRQGSHQTTTAPIGHIGMGRMIMRKNSAKGACVMNIGITNMKGGAMESKLRDYLESYHNIILTDSELDDILNIARQEIRLPDDKEIDDMVEEIRRNKWFDGRFAGAMIYGANLMKEKVRNPYPIKF